MAEPLFYPELKEDEISVKPIGFEALTEDTPDPDKRQRVDDRRIKHVKSEELQLIGSDKPKAKVRFRKSTVVLYYCILHMPYVGTTPSIIYIAFATLSSLCDIFIFICREKMIKILCFSRMALEKLVVY